MFLQERVSMNPYMVQYKPTSFGSDSSGTLAVAGAVGLAGILAVGALIGAVLGGEGLRLRSAIVGGIVAYILMKPKASP